MATRLLKVNNPQELAAAGVDGQTLIPAERLREEAPDTHCMLLDGGKIVACCSLWWRHVPALGQERLGIIGHFVAEHSEPALRLLKHCAAQLVENACSMAVGPMDGNTWRRYRFITDRGNEPLFFLEPDNRDEWPRVFLDAGFSPLATYTSALNLDLGRSNARNTAISNNMSQAGISIRHLDATRMEDELKRIYRLSLLAFRDNFLYTPLDESEFLAQYRKVLPHVRSELILVAERDSKPVAFLFTIPDLLRANREGKNDTIIIKTVAVSPDCAGMGLGTYLVEQAQQLAYQLGFQRSIHALMLESNRSRKISDHTATTMRRYTLYSLPLT
jgi:GNAT superfamily N-acetyltransferase